MYWNVCLNSNYYQQKIEPTYQQIYYNLISNKEFSTSIIRLLTLQDLNQYICSDSLQFRCLNLIITNTNLTSNMFKKSDPWEIRFKIVSKFFGFDTQDTNYQQSTDNAHRSLIATRSISEIHINQKAQQKNYQLKQKWKKLMKFPSKAVQSQAIELLIRQGSAIEDQTWTWMLRNSQKISPHLYSSKKTQLSSILYPQNSFGSCRNITDFRQIQNQQFDQQYKYNTSIKQSQKQPKKRKVSITKSGFYQRNNPNSLLFTQRTSNNSQASTFSGGNTSLNSHQTSQCNQTNPTGHLSFTTAIQNQSYMNRLFNGSSNENTMKSSYTSSCLAVPSHADSGFRLNESGFLTQDNHFNQIFSLSTKVNHPTLTSIIGSFLLHRPDFTYSVTLFNMAATFFYYTNSSEIKTFILLNHVACSQFFIIYLSTNNMSSNITTSNHNIMPSNPGYAHIISYITERIRKNCVQTVFLKNFKIENFVENWLFGFFYSVCQNGTQTKEKIIGYLLINGFTLESIVKVCQGIVKGLRKVINQGFQNNIYQCLQSPKHYLDQDILFEYLFQQ